MVGSSPTLGDLFDGPKSGQKSSQKSGQLDGIQDRGPWVAKDARWMDAVAYGKTLKQFAPFDSDYLRHDARLYEAYRVQAIDCLRRHHRLSMMRAYCVVDDAIAAHERLVPSLMSSSRKDAE